VISRVHSSILQGIDAVGCEVEADVVPSASRADIKLVGLAEKAVQESVSRIQAALRNSGCRWPDFGELPSASSGPEPVEGSRAGPKVTINLAPAEVKKESAAFDLPTCLRQATAGRSPWRALWPVDSLLARRWMTGGCRTAWPWMVGCGRCGARGPWR
jgi:magnesium chelatase family protein